MTSFKGRGAYPVLDLDKELQIVRSEEEITQLREQNARLVGEATKFFDENHRLCAAVVSTVHDITTLKTLGCAGR